MCYIDLELTSIMMERQISYTFIVGVGYKNDYPQINGATIFFKGYWYK